MLLANAAVDLLKVTFGSNNGNNITKIFYDAYLEYSLSRVLKYASKTPHDFECNRIVIQKILQTLVFI